MEINEAVSLQLFFLLTLCFTETIFFIFFNIVALQVGEDVTTLLPWSKVLFMRALTGVNICKLLIVIWFCNYTSKKGKETGVLVHKLFNVVQDRRSREEVSCDMIVKWWKWDCRFWHFVLAIDILHGASS